MLTILFAPLRLRIVRTLLLIVLVALALAAPSWIIADSWADDGGAKTAAFLGVFAVAIVGVVALWLAGAGARRGRERTLHGLLSLSPSDFEHAVARLLQRSGYRRVSVVGGSGDLAADIIAQSRGGQRVVVQCKRKAPGQRVGSAEMQKFIGMVNIHHGADAGIFVTTAGFTLPAIDLAEEHRIRLIDGEELVHIASGRSKIEGSRDRAA